MSKYLVDKVIRFEATSGAHIRMCIREAFLEAFSNMCDVVFIHNGKVYTVSPNYFSDIVIDRVDIPSLKEK